MEACQNCLTSCQLCAYRARERVCVPLRRCCWIAKERCCAPVRRCLAYLSDKYDKWLRVYNRWAEKYFGGCCPYGMLHILPVFLSLAGMIFTWLAAYDCTLFKIDNLSLRKVSVSVGIFTIQDFTTVTDNFQGVKGYQMWTTDHCVLWSQVQDSEVDKNDLDGPLKFARACATLAMMFSIPTFVAICMPVWQIREFEYFLIAAVAMIVNGILTLFYTIGLRSFWCQNYRDECSVGFAFVVAVLSFLCWTVSGIITLFLKKNERFMWTRPRHKRRKRNQQNNNNNNSANNNNNNNNDNSSNSNNNDHSESRSTSTASNNREEQEHAFADEEDPSERPPPKGYL